MHLSPHWGKAQNTVSWTVAPMMSTSNKERKEGGYAACFIASQTSLGFTCRFNYGKHLNYSIHWPCLELLNTRLQERWGTTEQQAPLQCQVNSVVFSEEVSFGFL